MTKLLSGNEMCEHFKVTRETLSNWRKRGMPSIKVEGVHRKYDLDEVVEWFKNKGQQQRAGTPNKEA